jgi:hypothetical protein
MKKGLKELVEDITLKEALNTLSIDITPRWMKFKKRLIYWDILDNIMFPILRLKGISISISHVFPRDDGKYVRVQCEVRNRDMEKFAECLQELYARLLILEDYDDYEVEIASQRKALGVICDVMYGDNTPDHFGRTFHMIDHTSKVQMKKKLIKLTKKKRESLSNAYK